MRLPRLFLRLALVLGCLFWVGSDLLFADGQDPAADQAWTLWHPSSVGVPLAGQYRQSNPLSGLSLPHLHGLAQEARLAVGGGVTAGTERIGGAIATVVPGRRAVWNGGGSFLADDTGYHLRSVLSLARPLGSRLMGGAGGGIVVADSDDGTNVGAGIDLGLRYDLGVFRDVSRVDLHAALLNIGLAAARDSYDPLIPAFTPLVGFRARAVESEEITLDLSGAIRAPAFGGIGFDLGAALVFSGGATAHIGWRGTLGEDEGALWPGFSLGMSFPLGRGSSSAPPEPRVYGVIQPDRDGNVLLGAELDVGFDTTDLTPPRVTALMESPREEGNREIALSSRGRNAELSLSIRAKDSRGIREVRSLLVDQEGAILRQWTLTPLVSTVPTGTVTERLTSDLWPRRISGSIHWNVYDDVPDGIYYLEVLAEDRSGNVTELSPWVIRVDSTPPRVEGSIVPVSLDGSSRGEKRFFYSSDAALSDDTGVGEEEILVAPQEEIDVVLRYQDVERLSVHVIDEAGRKILPLTGEPGRANGDHSLAIRWAGTDREGHRIPEGSYRIHVSASDALGNEGTAITPPIFLQSMRPRFTVALSDTIVSPSGGGLRSEILLTPRLEPVIGLREWSIRVVDEEGTVTARWSGIDLPPEEIRLGAEAFPADGIYTVQGYSYYRSGVQAEYVSDSIIVDTVPPAAGFALDRLRVQPEEQGIVTFYLEGDDTAVVTELYAIPRSPQGEGEPLLIRSWQVPPERYYWDLLTQAGEFLPPQDYTLRLYARDRAGNTGVSQDQSLTVLERLGGVALAPARSVFGPTGNGRFDVMPLILADSPGLDQGGEFSVEVHSLETGQEIRRFSGSLPVPPQILWDGRTDQGMPAPDGFYYALLEVSIPQRGVLRTESVPFRLKTDPPKVSFQAQPEIVSPDGDGRQDELILTPSLEGASTARYRLFRKNREDAREGGREIDARLPDPSLGEYIWTPRAQDGTILPDGHYEIVLEAEDEAGNLGRSDRVSFQVDTRPVSGFVRISAGAFSPESPSTNQVVFTPVLPVEEGLLRWSLEVVASQDEEGQSERLFFQEGDHEDPPGPIVWDGTDHRSGTIAADASYVARLEAVYRHGPKVKATSPPVLLDKTPPEVVVEVSPQPFSPDGDGVDDIVSFEILADDKSPIQYWMLEIFDPAGEFFYDVGGRGAPPGRVRWDGRARNGEVVMSAEEYPWRLEVADVLGNTRVVEGVLLVDILLERFGTGYRIQIPSIIFPPDSATLDLDPDSETGAKNRAVVHRLAEILRRFPDYAILVEGHAVNLSGTDREHRQELLPLSRERALQVRAALIDAGVPARLLSAEGRGGSDPLVPHDDEVQRWKNRRVDFLLNR
ncbi:OmpA family protein [Alkalispirochaeta americana]|uniref:OmpA family protein n=1 Tax=Alkalispirochaeta americana TaxID=159291 RepID=A0A1N6P5S4_9SPIO|nr:OmpA family protein [Alkalispirochaeta americana]SIP99616.1 OmpA family protein [Alkalispirochaeta americana]